MIDQIGTAADSAGARLRKALPGMVRDFVGLGAVASISYGAWLIEPAAGFMAGGGLVLAGVILTARSKPGA